MSKCKSKLLMTTIASMAVYATFLAMPTSGHAYEWSDGDNSAKVGGWLRNWTGFNVDEVPGAEQKVRWWDPAMVRNELLLDMDAKTGNVGWKFIGRYDGEIKTDYLSRIEALDTKGLQGYKNDGVTYMSQYNTTQFLDATREFYTSFNVGDRASFRIGKQQIVWGESDFFHAMDLISGFDYTSRLFFENNEEYRKPLMMVNTDINFPELDGDLNLFVRPGIDPGQSIGNSYSLNGGRWAVTPYEGVDFFSVTHYNYHAPDANKNDPTYGFRWKGDWHEIGYSLAYIKTFNPDPIMNPSRMNSTLSSFGVTSTEQWKGSNSAQVLGDWIYPEIQAIGGTANYYLEFADSVINFESVFVPNKPYNYGSLYSVLPGWSGIKEKDTQTSMIRVDHNVHFTQDFLGANRPSLSSFQAFDTWLLSFNPNDQIVQFASMGHPQHEHTTYLTYFILVNYFGDRLNPSFVFGLDASNGGGFILPAVEYVIGDAWRLKLEGDLFFDNHSKASSPLTVDGSKSNLLGLSENQTGLFGYFHGDSQVVARITRQF